MSHRITDRHRSALLCLALAACCLVWPNPAFAVLPQFTVQGGGWGHGIGMSQWGARGYALKGWKYDSILKHYYQGTAIKTVSTAKLLVKINLDDASAARSQWLIKTGSSSRLTVHDSSTTALLSSSDPYWITTSGGKTRVCKDVYSSTTHTHSVGSVIRTFSGSCIATAGGSVKIASGSGPFNASKVIWRGTIHFNVSTATTSKAINYVPMEDYVRGVIPCESPSSWPIESLKAQAVAARSYAYQDAKDGHTLWCTTMSQVYGGTMFENARSSSAATSTAGRVVWYGSETEPVKTFFMSCTGGHTANIEDVWLGSTPKPYYKGVTDADQASPNYSWTVGPFGTADLSGSLRAKDYLNHTLDYSVAYPATVTGIRCETASSGYARYVDVTWSNGNTFRVPGTTFQSALGLKSTHFSVSRSYPVESSARYEDSSSKLSWYGPWSAASVSSASGGTQRSSATSGSAVTASFTGTGVKWIGTLGPNRGKARVYVDGVYRATADLYSPSPAFRQTLYANYNLTPGSHSLKVVVRHVKDRRSSGYYVTFDAAVVINGTLSTATPPLVRYEQSASRIGRLGSWTTLPSSSYSGGSAVRTSSSAARAYVTFYGNEIRWIGTTAPTFGRARVRIDGGAAQYVTLTSSTTGFEKVVYRRTGLSQGRSHTLAIEALGTGGTKGYVDIDAIDVRGGWLLAPQIPAITVEQTSRANAYSGTWRTARSTKFSGGSHAWTTSHGASCTFTFEGTSVTWIDKRGTDYGKATVYLDGVRKGTVDQYASASATRRALWSSGTLSCKTHTLKIVCQHAKRSASKGYAIGVDAFRVTGRGIAH